MEGLHLEDSQTSVLGESSFSSKEYSGRNGTAQGLGRRSKSHAFLGFAANRLILFVDSHKVGAGVAFPI